MPHRSQLDPQWLAALQARACLPPLQPRLPLYAALGAALSAESAGSTTGQKHLIGSVLPTSIDEIGNLSPWIVNSLLYKTNNAENGQTGQAWLVAARDEVDLSTRLAQLAQALHDADVGHVRRHWRGEQLGVYGSHGDKVGSVERGAVRPLGIATRAVHLVGFSADGRVWVQQRSLSKSNNPGQWDTLMGGMVSAGDTLQSALARETWEEAGLQVTALGQLKMGGTVHIRRPTADLGDGGNDGGVGYVVEAIDWFSATVPLGLTPVNQDGEVAQFELLSRGELIDRLQHEKFTLEASLILVAALQSQAGRDGP